MNPNWPLEWKQLAPHITDLTKLATVSNMVDYMGKETMTWGHLAIDKYQCGFPQMFCTKMHESTRTCILIFPNCVWSTDYFYLNKTILQRYQNHTIVIIGSNSLSPGTSVHLIEIAFGSPGKQGVKRSSSILFSSVGDGPRIYKTKCWLNKYNGQQDGHFSFKQLFQYLNAIFQS